MNSYGLSMLANPAPCGHIVFPYTHESHWLEAVTLFASAGLGKNEAVLLVTTTEHAAILRTRLVEEGFDMHALERSGQLVWGDAAELLSTFVFDGIVDELVFKNKIANMIQTAMFSGGINRPVRVFGEMVSLMWTDNPHATERLEQLWNDVIAAHKVPLLCAYALAGSKATQLPQSLVTCHSHAIAQ
jgi:hypothetical protein